MLNIREKLIELLESAESAVYWDSSDRSFVEKIADHLIASGVTFATDNNVGHWIPVSERLPNKKGTYLVCTDAFGIVLAHWYGDKFGGGYASKHIAYWMPLPEPPKEEAYG